MARERRVVKRGGGKGPGGGKNGELSHKKDFT